MIYFISDGEYLKIGYTAGDIEARITALQVGNARKLKLVGHIDGGRETEAMLHRVFHEFNVGGEWFLYNLEKIQSMNNDNDGANNDANDSYDDTIGQSARIAGILTESDLPHLNLLRKKIVYTMIQHPAMSISEVARRCETSRPTVTKMRKMFKDVIEDYSYELTEKQLNEYTLIMGYQTNSERTPEPECDADEADEL